MDIYPGFFRITSTTNKRIFDIVLFHFINSIGQTVPKTIIDTIIYFFYARFKDNVLR